MCVYLSVCICNEICKRKVSFKKSICKLLVIYRVVQLFENSSILLYLGSEKKISLALSHFFKQRKAKQSLSCISQFLFVAKRKGKRKENLPVLYEP